MPHALKPCSVSRCPELVTAGRCEAHRKAAEVTRGTSHQRGYDTRHHAFRRRVLARDLFCVCSDPTHAHAQPCGLQTTVADHYPLTKRELREQGLNEHDPAHGRGLCKGCHDRHTSATSPGGWRLHHAG